MRRRAQIIVRALRLSIALGAASIAPRALDAQNLTPLPDTSVVVGDRLQLRIVAPQSAQCTASLQSIERDTLVVSAAVARGCPAGAYQASVHVYRGERPGRLKQSSIGGLVIGAALAMAGYIIFGCEHIGCERDPSRNGAALGVFIGVPLGAIGGALLPTGPRWESRGKARAVRIAGLALNPGLHVAAGPPR